MIKNALNMPDADVLLLDDIFSLEETDRFLIQLLEDTPWEQGEITLFGKRVQEPRLSAWYGDPESEYVYSGRLMKPQPWSETLSIIKQRIEEALNVKFNSCLLNYYRNGQDGMGFHSDDEKELGIEPVIASVSFGENRPLHFKHKYDNTIPTIKVDQVHGSVLVMHGRTQTNYKHGIPKTKRNVGKRVNLTFRMIK